MIVNNPYSLKSILNLDKQGFSQRRVNNLLMIFLNENY
jgi:hypothetical protein